MDKREPDIIAAPGFVEDSDANVGRIIGATLTLSIVPILITLFTWFLKKKKYSDKNKALLYYGISTALFFLLLVVNHPQS